jgi:hypothetical protein
MSKTKDDKNDKKSPVVRALVKQWDAKRWGPFLEMFGLEDEDTRDRLVRLLIVHLMLDSAVTAVLTARFLDRRLLNPHSEIEAAVSALSMSKRIELARASQLISASCAKGMTTVNKVRNKVAHYNPKHGLGMKHVKEISSDEAFEEFINEGKRALDEAAQTVVSNMEAL